MRRGVRDGWLLAYGAAFVIIAMVFQVFYTSHMIAESERRNCGNLRADIEAYQEVPPSTPTGWNQWNSKVERYRGIPCEPLLGPVPQPPPSLTSKPK